MEVTDVPGLPALWRRTRGDRRVRIAILDGPVDRAHPCFTGAALEQSPHFSAAPEDLQGSLAAHGTHVASVILGRDSVAGVAPGCTGLSLVLLPNRKRAVPQMELARAIEAAVEAGAHVINLSAGQFTDTGQADDLLLRAIELCEARNVLVVAAAGNDGCECLHVPAALPATLAVGAHDAAGAPVDFSNWGEDYLQNGILAPGENILGAIPGGQTARMSGTSMATPIVTGAVALLLSLQLQRGEPPDPFRVRQLLLDSADPCAGPDPDACRRALAGSINLARALELFDRGAPAGGRSAGPTLSLHPGVRVEHPAEGVVELRHAFGPSCLLQMSSPALKQALQTLAGPGERAGRLRQRVLEGAGIRTSAAMDDLLGRLGDGGFLCRTAQDGALAIATLVPLGAEFRWRDQRPRPDVRYRLSRFAFVRRAEGRLQLETPLTSARLEIRHPSALTLVAALETPARLEDLSARGCTLSAEGCAELLGLLLAMEAVTPVARGGRSEEDDRVPSTWEFHDLVFHAATRSSLPQTAFRFGKPADFLGNAGAPKPAMAARAIALPRPDIARLRREDPSFAEVLETRVSCREMADEPLGLQPLAELLYRSARVVRRSMLGHVLRARPYPAGGAFYPELYVAAWRCSGLEPGLYHFQPADHALGALSRDGALLDTLLAAVNQAWASVNRPPVLIVLTNRFPQAAAKYEATSYALALKNASMLLNTLCLNAHAMGLGACPIGMGDTRAFIEASGLDGLVEGPVAELAVGVPARNAPT